MATRYWIPLVFSLIAADAQAGWFSYDSYEDCMLGRMKGQPQSMYSVADRACSREFKRDVYVPVSEVEWEFSGVLVLAVNIVSSPGYEITKGEFLFSRKTCKEVAQASDWEKPMKLTFKYNRGLPNVPVEKPLFFCAKAIDFKGIYK